MNKSEQTDALFAALSKAQAEIEGAMKDSSNPHFKSKYADLASVMSACKGPLTRNGLSVTQLPDSDDPDIVAVTTVLGHASGQWISSRFVMRPAQSTPHGLMAALTYCRRGALAAIAGVCPEDDDGNAASGVGQEAAQFPLGVVVAAIEAGDSLKMFALSKSDEQGFRNAFGRLNMKQKSICRTLEHEGVTKLNEYIVGLEERAAADDSSGVQELVSELADPTVKGLVWHSLTPDTRAYIKSLKAA